MHPAATGRALAMTAGADLVVLDRQGDPRQAEIDAAGKQQNRT